MIYKQFINKRNRSYIYCIFVFYRAIHVSINLPPSTRRRFYVCIQFSIWIHINGRLHFMLRSSAYPLLRTLPNVYYIHFYRVLPVPANAPLELRPYSDNFYTVCFYFFYALLSSSVFCSSFVPLSCQITRFHMFYSKSTFAAYLYPI